MADLFHLSMPALHVVIGPVVVAHSKYIYHMEIEKAELPSDHVELKYVMKADNNSLTLKSRPLSICSKCTTLHSQV